MRLSKCKPVPVAAQSKS